MKFLVQVRVDAARMAEFGAKLGKGELDRSRVRSETVCLKAEPEVGFSVWEAESPEAFERVFAAWKPYYRETLVREVITPGEAMTAIAGGL